MSDQANDILLLTNAIRQLCEDDHLRLLQATYTKDFYERCAIIDGMSREGKAILAHAFERMTALKQPEALPRPLVYEN